MLQGVNQRGFFEVDEYVVYNSSQQRLRYLVQFQDMDPKQKQQQQQQLGVPSTPLPTTPFASTPRALETKTTETLPLPEPRSIRALQGNYGTEQLVSAATALQEIFALAAAVDDPTKNSAGAKKPAAAPAKEVGLVTQGGEPMPLQAVQVRAQLLDLVAKVVVLQQYQNRGTEMVESKFVFPLDESAAVCGFEVGF